MTLLEMTQNILSAMNSDEVNSISDTPESLQVATAIKTSYMNMLDRLSMPEHNQLVQLTASGNPDAPVLMYMPDGCTKINWLKYFDTNPADGTQLQTDQFGAYSVHDVNVDLQTNANGWSTTSLTSNTIQTGSVTFTVDNNLLISAGDFAWALPTSTSNVWMYGTVISYTGTTLVMNMTEIQGSGTYANWNINQLGPQALAAPGYKTVFILPIKEFINMTSAFNRTESDVESFDLQVTNNTTGLPQQFTFVYKNNIQPRHCCIINNYYIIFDSYDNTQDSTLQSSKTMAMGWVMPTFSMTDTFIPNIDDQRFSLLLNEAKSLAFNEIKNQPHPKSEKEVVRQLAGYQKYKSIANRPNYFDELPDFGRHGGMATLGASAGALFG
ncbi:MAG: hypothetical protein KGI25_08045 [Thaumarchaeota archaeon]|nr:hypothetical protein [Nitrososphaerota archaeon]